MDIWPCRWDQRREGSLWGPQWVLGSQGRNALTSRNNYYRQSVGRRSPQSTAPQWHNSLVYHVCFMFSSGVGQWFSCASYVSHWHALIGWQASDVCLIFPTDILQQAVICALCFPLVCLNRPSCVPCFPLACLSRLSCLPYASHCHASLGSHVCPLFFTGMLQEALCASQRLPVGTPVSYYGGSSSRLVGFIPWQDFVVLLSPSKNWYHRT